MSEISLKIFGCVYFIIRLTNIQKRAPFNFFIRQEMRFNFPLLASSAIHYRVKCLPGKEETSWSAKIARLKTLMGVVREGQLGNA